MISFDFSYSIGIWHSMSVLQILLRLVGYTQLCPNGPRRFVRGAKLNIMKILDIPFVIIV